MKKAVSILLIVAGIAIILYPAVKRDYAARQQAKILKELDQYITDTSEDESSDSSVSSSAASKSPSPSQSASSDEDKKKAEMDAYIKKNIEGVLKIPEIDLNMPVLKGASKKNLAISPSSMDGTGKAGTVCNYCIAGHRSRTYGHQFNRLGELKKGDKIFFQSTSDTFTYTISDIKLVKATDASLLAPVKGEKLMTLITCDYRLKPTGRLIVTAVMER